MLTCGAKMSQPFYDFLARVLAETSRASLGPGFAPNGAVVAYDNKLAELWRLNFIHAFVSEVGFSALDASSKDTATLCVKLAPDETIIDTTNVGKPAATGSVTDSAQNRMERWMCSNFRLKIDGLHCETVSRIEAITVTQLLEPERRDANSPAFPKVSNLLITLRDDSKAAEFYDWHQSFVIAGKNGQNQEKNGTLELLAANMKDVLFTLHLNSLGIFRLAPIPASADAIPRIQAEMYCDQVLFTMGSAVATTTAQPGPTNATQISAPPAGRQLGVAATPIPATIINKKPT